MQITDLIGKNIGILGFGQEGQAVLSYLHKHDVVPTIFDETPQEQWNESAKKLLADTGVTATAGLNAFKSIADCTLLFRSPGVWRNHPEILNAEAQGTIISSQAKLFFENTPATIVGITGTKGKGTTSSLIYQTALNAGKSVYLTGNIGKVQPLDILDSTTDEDIVIYELSSFQLQDLTQSPHIGVCLMVTSDHLDHHSDLQEYHAAKTNIVAHQSTNDVAIFNADYPTSVAIGELGDGAKYYVSAKHEQKSGAFISADNIFLQGLPNQTENLIIDCKNRKLRGAHNLENIAAAALASYHLGISPEIITTISNSFSGLEHRLQYVATVNEVAYYNDSISTVPETTIAAIHSFTEPINLLLGGSEKGVSYNGLIAEIKSASNIASITFLGDVGHQLYDLLVDKTSIPLYGPYTDFKQAIIRVKEIAVPGEIVLLSPAAASFDMFKNYADRGNQFVALITQ